MKDHENHAESSDEQDRAAHNTSDPFLADDAVYEYNGLDDTAARHDDYLYGEPYPSPRDWPH